MCPRERATIRPSPSSFPLSHLRSVALDHRRAVTLQSDLLALQHSDTHLDQLRHRRAHLPERADVQTLDATLADLRGRPREAEQPADRPLPQPEPSRGRGRVGRAEARGGRPEAVRGHGAARAAGARWTRATRCERRQRSLEDELLEIMELAEPVAAQLASLGGAAAGPPTAGSKSPVPHSRRGREHRGRRAPRGRGAASGRSRRHRGPAAQGVRAAAGAGSTASR